MRQVQTGNTPRFWRWLRWAFYAAGVLAVLAAASLGVMTTSWFQRVVERHLIASLQQLTGGRTEITGLRLAPLSLRVFVRQVVLHGTELPSSRPLFSARYVAVRINPAALFHRKLMLSSVEWAEAAIQVRTTPDGSSNFPGPMVPFTADQALNELLNWSVGRLTLAHTTIFWNDQRLPLELRARDLTLLLRLSPPRGYLGSLSSSALELRFDQRSIPPIALTSQFEFSRAELTVTSLAWRSQPFSGLCSLNLRYAPATEAYLAFQATGEVPALAQTLDLPLLRAGRLEVRGQGTYQKEKLSLRGGIKAEQLLVQTAWFRPGRVDLSANYRTDRQGIELSNLKVNAWGGTIQGRMEILTGKPSPRFALYSQLQGLSAAATVRAVEARAAVLRQLRLASRIHGSANATWEGRFENLQSQFNLQFQPEEEVTWGSLPAGGSARGSLILGRSSSLELRQGDLRTPHSELKAEGTLGSAQSSLAVNLTTSDFEEWRHLVESLSGTTERIPLSLQSRAAFSGLVSGPIDEVAIRGGLEAGGFHYRGKPWDGFAANVFLSPGRIEASSGRLWRGKSSLTLEAAATLDDWKLTPDSRVRLAARAHRTSLEDLVAALGASYPASGLLSGHLELEGTASSLAGTGALRIQQGAWVQESIDLLSANIRVAGSVWTLRDIRLSKGHGQAQGEIRFTPAGRSLAMEFRGDGFELADFKRLAPSDEPSALGGRATFDLSGEGTLDDPRARASLDLREITVRGSPVGDLQAQIDWEGRQVRVRGENTSLAGTVRFAGWARTEGGWPLEVTGQYTNLRVDPWIRLLRGGKLDTPITVSGSLSLAGLLKDPAQLELRSEVHSLEVKFPGFTWENAAPFNFRYRDRSLAADRFRMRGPGTDLEVGGTVGLGKQATLALNVQGQADAALLNLVDPALQPTGHLILKLRVGGTPDRPLYYGTAAVENVSLSYADSPLRLSGLNGEIRMEGERVSTRSLRGVSGGGTVAFSGYAALGDRPRFEMEAELAQVRARYPTDFASLLDGSLRLTGTPERTVLAGELNLRQVLVSEGFDWLTRLSAPRSPTGGAPPMVGSPFAARTQLNILVFSAPPVRLETRNLHLVADIDLRLQGTLANPVQVGTIHLESGDTVFRGNRYTLRRGEIIMTNPFRTEPVLDVEVHTQAQRYDITLDISGPFDRLKIAYRSDPPLSTPDILTLLAVGYSRREEEMSGATPSQSLPTVGASALLSEALSSQVTGRIQRLFGVSRIKIDPNVGGPGTGTGTRVTIEQQVTRDLTLTYVTNTAVSQQRIIQFEWELSDRVSLVGVRDQNGIFGMEFKLRRRFK